MAENTSLSASLSETIDALHREFGISCDLTVRRLTVAEKNAAVITVDGMVDRGMLSDAVVLPLGTVEGKYKNADDLVDELKNGILGFSDTEVTKDFNTLCDRITSGFAAVLVDGSCRAVLGGVQGFMMRTVNEPSTEVSVRGSREGFTEAVRVNMAMVRRRIKTPQLTFEMLTIGKDSKTDVCLCYLRDRVSEELLRDIRGRLKECPLDIVLESGYLQPFLEGKRRSLFSQIDTTERPDTLCGKVAEGRIGVMVDGTPFALIVPFLFVEHFQSVDDYSQHPFYASFIRIVKYVAFFVSLLLPGLYVAIGTHHAEMLPSVFLLSFINSDRATPFPLTVEAILIHFVFEIMREAGLRFPKSVGHAVSIVGALVIGESAVRAGLVGAPMVIIVALTSICAFVIPSLYGNIAILRFAFIVLGGGLGIYGISLGCLLLLCSICAMNMDSIPYTAPLSPFDISAMRDVFIRSDWRVLVKKRFLVQNVPGSHIKRQAGEKNHE